MNDLKDKNKITKRKNDRKSSNIHGGGREFYASKNLFPSFVLEIQSQSPASLFSPHSLYSFSCTYIYLYSSDPWIKLHPEGWVRRSRNEAKGRPQGRFVSFVSVTVVSFRYVLLPSYFFPYFFFSIPFFHLWTRLFFNDYQWSFVDIRIINYFSFL